MAYSYEKDLEDIVKKYINENADKYDLSEPDIALDDIWNDILDKILSEEPGYVAPNRASARQWVRENMSLLVAACDYNMEYAQDLFVSDPEYADNLIRRDVAYDVISKVLKAAK